MSDETVFNIIFEGHSLYPPNEEGRTRYVRLCWPRDHKGEFLRMPIPKGICTPNGYKWGHDLDEFFYVRRSESSSNSQSCWSRSMIKDRSEIYSESAWKSTDQDSVPHAITPFPVLELKLPQGEILSDYILNKRIASFGQIYTGCPEGKCDDETTLVDPSSPSKTTAASCTVSETGDIVVGRIPDAAPIDTPGDVSQVLVNNIGPKEPSISSSTIFSDKFFHVGNGTSPLKRQGCTVELRAYQPKYDYEGYSMPEAFGTEYDSPFSTEDIPKLEEFIPDMYLPDYLLVHDPHDVSVHCDGYRRGEDDFAAFSELPPPPRKYRRAQPEILKTKLGDAPESESWKERETVAHLYLHQNNCIGVGHHSFVYRAPLELPPPLSARSRNGRVIVAAKIAMHPDRKREMLKNEGEIYNKLPKHMSENWCGYNLVAPIPHPVPVGPIVPKFYGYYVPFEDSEEDGDPSPVLLLEECGEPIKPHRLTVDQKTECYSLMYRLHRENVVQNSFFVRNILRQPGPLHVAPEERSDDTPSFRIIDFGTATIYKQELRSKSDYNALVKKEFRSENRLARDELELDDEDFHF